MLFSFSRSVGAAFDGYFLFYRLKKRKQYVRYRPRKTRYERQCLHTWKYSAHIIQRAHGRFMTAKTRSCTSEKTSVRKTLKTEKICTDRFFSGLKARSRYRLSHRLRQPATVGCIREFRISAHYFQRSRFQV